jgi:uncharacterized membrane protein (Fun14 family)
LNGNRIYWIIKIHVETIKEFGNVLVRLGEAAIVGVAATWFVQSFSRWVTLSSVAGGFILVFSGLYFVNMSNLEKLAIEEQPEAQQS